MPCPILASLLPKEHSFEPGGQAFRRRLGLPGRELMGPRVYILGSFPHVSLLSSGLSGQCWQALCGELLFSRYV